MTQDGKPETLQEMREMGGKIRAEKLSKKQRSEIAKLGGKARKGWRKSKITQ